MAIASYVRVSSRSQDFDTQFDAIERAVKARGEEIDVVFSEKRSAKTLERPQLDDLRARARAGEFSKLYVFRLDRLSRSGIRDTLGVLEELNSHGCQVISVGDGFDLGGPAGDVVVAVMSWAAEMERLAIGERISAARKRVEAKGGRWGRPARVPLLKIIAMRDAQRAGKTIRAISAAMKVPRSTVAAVLSEKGPYAPPKYKPRKRASKKA